MHGELLGSEFRRILMFYIKPACLVDFVCYFCHTLLLYSMHCGLPDGESSEFSCLKSNLHVLLFTLCFVFAMLCCLFQCTVNY